MTEWQKGMSDWIQDNYRKISLSKRVNTLLSRRTGIKFVRCGTPIEDMTNDVHLPRTKQSLGHHNFSALRLNDTNERNSTQMSM